MPRIELTNAEFFHLRKDMKLQSDQSPVFRFFNMQKINHFHSANAMNIRIMDKKLDDLIKKYAMHDDAGNPLKQTNADNTETFQYIDEATRQQHIDEINEFMARSIYVEG